MPPGTYLRDYLEKKDELFPSSGMWGAIYVVDVPDVHSKMNVAKKIGNELSTMDSLADISGTFGFTVSFEQFVNDTIGGDKNYPQIALAKKQFYELLAEFLYTDGESQRDSLKFKEYLTCTAEAPELYIFQIPYRHKK